MGGTFKDYSALVGSTVGEWTVVDIFRPLRGPQKLVCRCSCGTVAQHHVHPFLKRVSSRCGACRRKGKHGMRRSPEWKSWSSMRERCNNPKHQSFVHYGGRGIRICDRWSDIDTGFAAFFSDMGRKPSRSHSIDRVDVNGHYEPGNCRWATQRQQQRNRRSNVLIEAFGRTQCVSAWAEEIGVTTECVLWRLQRWPIEQAVSQVSQKKSRAA